MKIAYIPYNKYSDNLTYDNRNILLYGKLKKLKIHNFNEKKKYDFLILPPSYDISDLNFISNRKEKIICQLVDNYLQEDSSIKNFLRGVIKFFLGQHKNLVLDYKKQLKKFLKTADHVLCASDMQKTEIQKINPNVTKVFEGNFSVFNGIKKNYKIKKKAIISWEGRAENLVNLEIFYEILKSLKKKINFYFFIFSDFYYSSFSGRFYKHLTLKKLNFYFKELISLNTTFKSSTVFFYQWNKLITPILLLKSDLLVIPAGNKNNFLKGRSPNKLLMAMRMGIPVLTTDISSYKKISIATGVDFCCSSKKDWEKKIFTYLKNEELRKKNSLKLKKYADKYYSEKNFIKIYDQIFSSLK